MTNDKVTLTTRAQIAYALPVASNAFIMQPVVLIQGIYAMYFGLSLTTIATVLLLSRIFDAITDPLIATFLTVQATVKPLSFVAGC